LKKLQGKQSTISFYISFSLFFPAELVPEEIRCPSVKNLRRVEALHDLPSAISEAVISFAIQEIN